MGAATCSRCECELIEPRDLVVGTCLPCSYPKPKTDAEAKVMRKFGTGATRNTDQDKWDFEGFLSGPVIAKFAEYMHKHRVQADRAIRDSDNWQKGIPMDAYIKSAWRHFFDWWQLHRGYPVRADEEGNPVTVEDALMGLLFNVQGYMHEVLKHERT